MKRLELTPNPEPIKILMNIKHDTLVDRVGNVDDTSAAITYLASESFVNGTSLVIDGGMCCIGLPGMLKFN